MTYRRCRTGAAEPPPSPLREGLFLPALDRFVVVDGLGLFLLVLDLERRRDVALRHSILVPVFEVVLFGHLRPEITLHARTLQTLHHLFLLGAERVHGLLCGLGARRSVAERP